MKTRTSALALATIALATTVACSSDDATKKDVTLTIVAYESFTPPEGIFDAFLSPWQLRERQPYKLEQPHPKIWCLFEKKFTK